MLIETFIWHLFSLRWRHNERNGVSNHRHIDCLLNRLFKRRSKKHQSSASLTFAGRIHRWPVISPHKGPITRFFFHLKASSCLFGQVLCTNDNLLHSWKYKFVIWYCPQQHGILLKHDKIVILCFVFHMLPDKLVFYCDHFIVMVYVPYLCDDAIIFYNFNLAKYNRIFPNGARSILIHIPICVSILPTPQPLTLQQQNCTLFAFVIFWSG